MKLLHQLRSFFRKDKLDTEMADEMRHHVELQTELNRKAGMNAEDAHYAALRQFGNVAVIQEQAREWRGWLGVEQWLQDGRHAARRLRKSPVFTAVSVFTLALGLGACATLFTVVNAVLVRPIALSESARLVVLQETHPRYATTGVSPANFRLWREYADGLESIAVRSDYSSTLVTQREATRVAVAGVTGRYFEMLRCAPAAGRMFGEAEQMPGQGAVIVLTHGFWQRHFEGSLEVVGSGVRLGDRMVTVLGVTPAEFPSEGNDLFAPIEVPEAVWNSHERLFSRVLARLKPGVSVGQAQQQMNSLAERQAKAFSQENRDWTVRVTRLIDFETREVRPVLLALFTAVAVLLLIVCVTVANLFLVRAAARQRETAMRAALGASRGRILREFITESLLLALAGGLLALTVAKAGVDALLLLAPFDVPRTSEIVLDAPVLGFVIAVSLLAGLGIGALPAWLSSRAHLLKITGAVGDGPAAGRVRHLLVVAQIALALMLLVSSGLLIRSFMRLSAADPGFKADGALMLKVQTQHRTAGQQEGFVTTLADRFRTLPGVTAVGAIYPLPFGEEDWSFRLEVEAHAVPFNERPGILHYRVTPDYLRAMEIPLRRGRAFGAQDHAGGPRVALVSQSLADRVFPGENPVGRRIRWNGHHRHEWREIVGVVGDVRHAGYDRDTAAQVYEPFAQATSNIVSFVVRAEGAPTVLGALLRRELRAVESEVPVVRLDFLEDIVAGSFARQRFATLLFAVFSTVALLLAAAGVYGVTACAVAQRTREFGVRLALGAQGRDLRQMVVARGLRLVFLGSAAGLLGAAMTTRMIQSLLYEVVPHDLTVFAANVVLIVVVTLAACWIPARRAAKVDPMVALRAE